MSRRTQGAIGYAAARALASRYNDRRIVEALESRTLLSISGIPDWVEQGPGPILNTADQTEAVGAMDAIAIHPTNANVMYAGSVNGGVWKTTNANASSPNWVPLTDQFPGTSISDIAFDPLDSSGNTVWAANGAYSNMYENAPLRGLLRTTDAGSHWTEVGVSTFSGHSIRTVLPTPIATATGQRIRVAAQSSWIRRRSTLSMSRAAALLLSSRRPAPKSER
jgi:hypothetical protein